VAICATMKYIVVQEFGYPNYSYEVVCYFDTEEKAHQSASLRNYENELQRKIGRLTGKFVQCHSYKVMAVKEGDEPATIEYIDEMYREALENARKVKAEKDEIKEKEIKEAQSKRLADYIVMRQRPA